MTHREAHKQRNALHTALILVAMFALILMLGYNLFGMTVTMILLMFSAVLVMLLPQASPWLSLRLQRVQAISYRQAPELYDLVTALSRRAGLAYLPELYLIPSNRLNAFAMQERGKPLIALTSAMLNSMPRRELAAVMAHEIGHIRNADLYVMMLADFFNRVTTALSQAGLVFIVILLPLWLLGGWSLSIWIVVLLVLAPFASTLLQLALSRTREFDADIEAASLTADPLALVSALQRIEWCSQPWWRRWWPSYRQDQTSLWRTHPLTTERIERLEQMAQDYSTHHQYGEHGRGMMQTTFLDPDGVTSAHFPVRLW